LDKVKYFDSVSDVTTGFIVHYLKMCLITETRSMSWTLINVL